MTPQEELARVNAQLELEDINEQLATEEAPKAEPVERMGTLEKTGRALSTAAGGFNKGMVDVANIPFALSGAAARGFNSLMGRPEPETYDLYDSPVVGDFLKTATSPALPEGEEPISEFVGKALEWGGGGVFNAAKKGPLLLDTLMGLGAATGDAVGGETGEIMGGMGGALASVLRGELPKGLTDKIPFASTKAEKSGRTAEKLIKQNLADPELAEQTLRGNYEDGIKGTLLDLTDDAGLAGLEQGGGLTTKGSVDYMDTVAARQAQIMDDVAAPFGDETAEAAQEAASGLRKARNSSIEQAGKGRIAAQQAQAEQGLAQTRAQIDQYDEVVDTVQREADDVGTVIAPQRKTHEVSTSASTRIDEAEAAYKATEEAPKWKIFDEGPAEEAFGLKAAVDKVYSPLVDETKAVMREGYGKQLDMIDAWKGDVKPESISSVRSQISEKINAADNYGTAEKRMSEVVDALDKRLAEVGNTAYSDAVAATKGRYDKYHSGELGKRRRKGVPATLLERTKFSGDAGKVDAQSLKATGIDDLQGDVQDYFKDKVKGETVDAKFMAKYDGFFSEFPAIGEDYANMAAANAKSTEAQGLSKAMTAKYKTQQAGYEKAAESVVPQTEKKVGELKSRADKAVTAQYAQKPNATLKAILSDSDRVNDLKKLRVAMDEKGTTASLKGHVGDIVKDKVGDINQGVGVTKTNAEKQLRAMETQLVDSGIVTQAEFDKMQQATIRASRSKGLRKAGADAQIDKAGDELASLFASGAASAVLPLIPGSHALIMGGVLRRNFKRMLGKTDYDPVALARVDEFLSNPKAYIDQLDAPAKAKIAASETAEQAAKSIATQVFAGAQALADDEE